MPQAKQSRTIPVILEVRDNGDPPLTACRRVIATAVPYP